jgi:hypothetical protein
MIRNIRIECTFIPDKKAPECLHAKEQITLT